MEDLLGLNGCKNQLKTLYLIFHDSENRLYFFFEKFIMKKVRAFEIIYFLVAVTLTGVFLHCNLEK